MIGISCGVLSVLALIAVLTGAATYFMSRSVAAALSAAALTFGAELLAIALYLVRFRHH